MFVPITRLAVIIFVIGLSACGSNGGGGGGGGGAEPSQTDAAATESPVAEDVIDPGELTSEEIDEIIDEVIAENDIEEYGGLAQEVPEADTSTDLFVVTEEAQSPATMDQFLTAVLNDIDRYWSATFAAEGLPEPQVLYLWPTTGEVYDDGCGDQTDDTTALYCPANDTIIVSQVLAHDLWNGLAQTPYGPRQSETLGDFAVAYLLGHEFGHSIQAELDLLNKFPVWQTELMADCFAGNWANSAYYTGILEPGDVEEAVEAANLIGDYEFTNPLHHGTPDERVTAFNLGWNGGNPVDCFVYLQQ